MNYLERLVDEKKQLQGQLERAKRAVEELTRKDDELAEIIETLAQLKRYRGEEE